MLSFCLPEFFTLVLVGQRHLSINRDGEGFGKYYRKTAERKLDVIFTAPIQIRILQQSNCPEKQVTVMTENLLNAFTHLLSPTFSMSIAMPDRLILLGFLPVRRQQSQEA